MALKTEKDSKVRGIISDIRWQTDLHLTSQRKVILETLIENSDQHLSVDDIYSLIKEKNDFIGLATIYRNLDLLEELGVVVKRNFDDKSAKYEFIFGDKLKHHHLICESCGKVMEIENFLPDGLKEEVMETKEFQITDYSLQIYGYCKECRSNS
ncbi:Fur family transcriptional regulator [Acetohalobium arabaticum]|uniref:Ferric uptake regulator, Fur family n=1 Tax=Acetohalobium arabaticum (strain ATCC 49924 / DSM 5501 / Z-7288) TaxID=574087 RepID=D9QS11_ACEAZ|nr:transcriptional repressor [Acetohalobium arabaticum]ADL13302.1 ferric uptake regulator, Fur family [Acetohalobium arabaticum DSM 5501]